tara:strand:+ start:1330 stop:1641 length:312 start_codon:yes stop_codon:yes gene_type:complete
MQFHKKITCADGFNMSVQAGDSHYCEPRVDNAAKYTSVEIGYPSEPEELLLPWVEDPSNPTQTVYGWVPAHIVTLVCVKHGGVVEGELPNGIPCLEPRTMEKK